MPITYRYGQQAEQPNQPSQEQKVPTPPAKDPQEDNRPLGIVSDIVNWFNQPLLHQIGLKGILDRVAQPEKDEIDPEGNLSLGGYAKAFLTGALEGASKPSTIAQAASLGTSGLPAVVANVPSILEGANVAFDPNRTTGERVLGGVQAASGAIGSGVSGYLGKQDISPLSAVAKARAARTAPTTLGLNTPDPINSIDTPAPLVQRGLRNSPAMPTESDLTKAGKEGQGFVLNRAKGTAELTQPEHTYLTSQMNKDPKGDVAQAIYGREGRPQESSIVESLEAEEAAAKMKASEGDKAIRAAASEESMKNKLWTQEARNESAREKFLSKEATQEARNLNTRDKFIAKSADRAEKQRMKDATQEAKNLNVRDKVLAEQDEAAKVAELKAGLEPGSPVVTERYKSGPDTATIKWAEAEPPKGGGGSTTPRGTVTPGGVIMDLDELFNKIPDAPPVSKAAAPIVGFKPSGKVHKTFIQAQGEAKKLGLGKEAVQKVEGGYIVSPKDDGGLAGPAAAPVKPEGPTPKGGPAGDEIELGGAPPKYPEQTEANAQMRAEIDAERRSPNRVNTAPEDKKYQLAREMAIRKGEEARASKTATPTSNIIPVESLKKTPLEVAGEHYGTVKAEAKAGNVPEEGRAVAGRAAQRMKKEDDIAKQISALEQDLNDPNVPDEFKSILRQSIVRLRTGDPNAMSVDTGQQFGPRFPEENVVGPHGPRNQPQTRSENLITVDTKGTKTSKEVQDRVIAALETKLAEVQSSGGKAVTFQANKAYGGREGTVFLGEDPIAHIDRYGNVKVSYGVDEEISKLLPKSLTGVRDATPGEMSRAAMGQISQALTSTRGTGGGKFTIEVSNGPRFTIDKEPMAIQRVIQKIRSSSGAWGDLAETPKKAKTRNIIPAEEFTTLKGDTPTVSNEPQIGSPRWQALQDTMKGEKGEIAPELQARILGSGVGALGGSAYGAASTEEGESKLKNAIIYGLLGAGAGAALPDIPWAVSNPREVATKLKDGIVQAAKLYPDIQRGNLLLNMPNLLINAVAGPYGSAIHGSLERALTGDKRGIEALKLLASPKLHFFRQYGQGFKEAGERAEQMASRAEMSRAMQEAPQLVRDIVGAPGQFLTAGDIAARDILMRAGFTMDEARAMTLTDEPSMNTFKALVDLKRGPGAQSWALQTALPFVRTIANQVEGGLERFPVLGALYQLKKTNPEPRHLVMVQQGLGLGVIGLSAALGTMIEPDVATSPLVAKILGNVGGQYGSLATAAFAAGQALQMGDENAITKFIDTMAYGVPLPTTRPVSDPTNLAEKAMSGDLQPEDVPNSIWPQIFKPSTFEAVHEGVGRMLGSESQPTESLY